MTLIQKLNAVFVALTISIAGVSTTAIATDKKVLDVIVASSARGNTMKQGIMLHKALQERGYDSEIIHTKNCNKNKAYIAQATRPGFFLKSGTSWVSDILTKKCVNPPSEETYVTPFFYRSNAMCVRKSDNIGNLKNIMSWIKAKDRVTMATFANVPDDFAQLGEQFGNKWKKVAYKGSSGTLKGFLAGDTDLMYIGYTAREINSPGLDCFATTDGVNGTQKFAKLFPNWQLGRLVNLTYAHGVAMNAEQKADTRAVIQDMLANDAKLSKYYATSFIPTSAELEKRGIGLKDFWNDVRDWFPGGATPEMIKSWKAGEKAN